MLARHGTRNPREGWNAGPGTVARCTHKATVLPYELHSGVGNSFCRTTRHLKRLALMEYDIPQEEAYDPTVKWHLHLAHPCLTCMFLCTKS